MIISSKPIVNVIPFQEPICGTKTVRKNGEILSYDRISVVLACFEGFSLCQHQDPTEEV